MSLIPPSIPPAQPSRRTLGSLLGMEPPKDDLASSGESAHADDRAASAPSRLPLTRVSAKVRIVGDCAQTELQEHYTNTHDRPLDVTHTIPLPHGAAVTGVEIIAGDRTVRGACHRLPEARERHLGAKRRGKTSALIEQRRDDIHTIMLANVPAGASIVITLRIVERLRAADGRFEYRLPTGISPKHVPGAPTGHEGDGWSADTTRAPDASHLTPPVLVGAGIPIELDLAIAAGATDIQSSLALERTDDADGSIRLRPASPPACGNDIVIRFWGRDTAPTLRAYSDGARTLVVVDPPLARHKDCERPREVVYVLDHSGSMSGPRLTAAKRALVASLRSLSPRDRVQIIAFSDSFAKFRPRPTLAGADTVAAAIRWLEHIQSTGGTNALEALAAACTTAVAAKRVRTVLLITDGDVANDAEILQLTSRIDPATRLFALGIGTGPSHALLSRLARLGGGTYTSVSSHDAIEHEVLAFEHATVGPIAFGLRESDADAADTATQGDLFAGRATSFFLEGHRDRVRISSVDGHFCAECAVHSSPMPLGALWARDQIERLEDRRIALPARADEIDAQIAELGVTHQIQTRLTSFVAVDEASQVIGDGLSLVQPTSAPEDHALVRACMAAPPRRSISSHWIADRHVMDRPDEDECRYAPPSQDERLDRAGSWIGRSVPTQDRRRPAPRTLPVITLLGGTGGLPRGFGSRNAWMRCGLAVLVGAKDAEALRQISRKMEFARIYSPEDLDAEPATLAHSLVMLILRAAWDARNWKVGASGGQPKADSLQPPPERWEPAIEVMKAHAAQPGVAEFMAAADACDIPAMIRAAVRVAHEAARPARR